MHEWTAGRKEGTKKGRNKGWKVKEKTRMKENE